MFGLYEDEKRDDPYNPNNGSLYVNPFRDGDKSAQDTLTDLYESEFQDYLDRFFPVEQDLIQQMTTGFEGLQQEEIGRAQSAVAKQYAVSRGQQTRRRAGYGLDPSENTQGDFNRSETSAIVAAKNFARERSEQRRMDIISGGLGAVRDRSVLQGVG
jgi:hypothetical protein|tara:strand:- start:2929 stop:3399 length:471 start_codon:yes stop_codon:yes gene_type:complete